MTPIPFQSRFIERLAIALIVLLIGLIAALKARDPTQWSDFQTFLTVGALQDTGEIHRAHDPQFMQQMLENVGVSQPPLAWSYPPPFTAATVILAKLPVQYAYPLFQLCSMFLLLAGLRKLAPTERSFVLAAAYPAILFNVNYCQNGALTAGLIAWCSLLLLHQHKITGLPLGLLVIKPHLAVGITLFAVMKRQGRTLLVAAGTVAIVCLLSTWLLGSRIWPAFIDSISHTSASLQVGDFPLYRMTSPYAMARLLGLGTDAAIVIQASGILFWLATLAHAAYVGYSLRRVLTLAVAGTLLVSPYLYDYDMPLLGVAIALASPDLAAAGSRIERMSILVLSWLIPSMALIGAFPAMYQVLVLDGPFDYPVWLEGRITVAGFLVVILMCQLTCICWRAHRAGVSHPLN